MFAVYDRTGFRASSVNFDTLGAAKAHAESLRNDTNGHYNVVQIVTVWTTQTANEAITDDLKGRVAASINGAQGGEKHTYGTCRLCGAPLNAGGTCTHPD